SELSLTSRLLRQRLWTSFVVAVCVGGGLVAAGLYFGTLRPNAERAIASLQQSLLAERETRSALQQREARSRLVADELSSRVSSLEQSLRTERARWFTQPTASNPPRKPITREPLPVAANVKPCRDDGDPLNPCLKR
ncbi:MAG TPA: hypothetical protein VGC79_33510, partial [Polyangiaceae bacterium]